MPRRSVFQVVNDPTLFHAVQMHPRAGIALGFQGFARWLGEHLVDFPTLTHEHHVGVTIYRMRVEYFGRALFDSPVINVDAGLRSRSDGGLLFLDADLSMRGQRFLRVELILCPVQIGEDTALSAVAGPLSPDVLEKFMPDELVDAAPPPVVQPAIRKLDSSGAVRTEFSSPFIVHRSMCELADQWCFLAVTDLAGHARELMVRGVATQHPNLRKGLRPLAAIDVELRRPLFYLDEGSVGTTAYMTEHGPTFVHQLRGGAGGTLHGTVIERIAV
jgi:hypothetical protein